ncbi:MAG: N-acetylglucosamine-6-phosphate deacetylase, partial [Treponema sp.]|nr:N-acetylglucosamine-6-phosphate deacetylase [Treponema sp.]
MIRHIFGDRIFNEETGGFSAGDIYIEGERFTAPPGGNSRESGETLDYRGCFILPGFIDIHTHGGFGRAFFECSPEETGRTARYFAAAGVSAFCPATVSGDEEACRRGMETLARSPAFGGAPQDGGSSPGGPASPTARIAGVYQEGPFLSPKKPGVADLASFRKPDTAYFAGLQRHGESLGLAIPFVTVAPELEGALDFIGEFSSRAVCALAHSTADYETAARAFAAGASQLTHLFNAMPPLLHREPGLIGAALDSPGVMAELIADGEHVHPSAVRAAFRMFGDDRIILISDSLFSGLPDGDYAAGGLSVTIKGGVAKNSAGALAGSSKTLGHCVLNAVKHIGIPLYSAAKCASVNPAKQAGIFHERGSITAGKYADLVILDGDYNLKEV